MTRRWTLASVSKSSKRRSREPRQKPQPPKQRVMCRACRVWMDEDQKPEHSGMPSHIVAVQRWIVYQACDSVSPPGCKQP